MKYNYHADHTEPTNEYSIFVFGSNLAARHGGGAARLAAQKYGASKKVPEGISGRSYAIPTKDINIESLPLDEIRIAIAKFVGYAIENPDEEFFMTRVGCVLAGYKDEEIAPMFIGAPMNVDFPMEWKEFLEPSEGVITTYKGFDQDMKCRDFQYEVGGTYTHNGEVGACIGGFHACEYPLDVLSYYAAGSRYAIVEQSGDLSRHEEDSKVASRTIKISAEIGIPGLIKAAIEYTFSRCLPVNPKSPAFSDGTRGAASATGYSGAASATGTKSVAMASGRNGKAKGVEGGAIFLVFRDMNWNIIHAKASKVGENGVKPNVFYMLDEAGEFVEAV